MHSMDGLKKLPKVNDLNPEAGNASWTFNDAAMAEAICVAQPF